jgi:ribonuclease HI
MTILKYFTDDPPIQMIIYDIFTDGSEIKDRNTYKTLSVDWAYIIKKNRILIETNSDAIPNINLGNNQRAELLAIYKSLEAISSVTNTGNVEINLYTDSDYAKKCVTIWCSTWKKNGWKTANKKEVKHRDIIEPCVFLINSLRSKGFMFSIHHIRAHTNKGDYYSIGNSEVDMIAIDSAKRMLL